MAFTSYKENKAKFLTYHNLHSKSALKRLEN